MTCPNLNHKDFKELMNKVGVFEAYKMWNENGGQIDLRSIQDSSNTVTNSIKNYNSTKNANEITKFVMPFKFVGFNNPVTMMGTYDTVTDEFDGKLLLPLGSLSVSEDHTLSINLEESKLSPYLKEQAVVKKLLNLYFASDEVSNKFPLSHVVYNDELIKFNDTGYLLPSPRYDNSEFESDLEFEKRQRNLTGVKDGSIDTIVTMIDGVKIGNTYFANTTEMTVPTDSKGLRQELEAKRGAIRGRIQSLIDKIGMDRFHRVIALTANNKSTLTAALSKKVDADAFSNYIINSLVNNEELVGDLKQIADDVTRGIDTNRRTQLSIPDIELGAKSEAQRQVEEKLNAKERELSFINTLRSDVNPFTLIPEREHKYITGNGITLEFSATSLLASFDDFLFDDFKYIYTEGIARHPKLKDHFIVKDASGNVNEHASTIKRHTFTEAILKNDISIYYDKYPINKVFPLSHEKKITIATSEFISEDEVTEKSSVVLEYTNPAQKDAFLKEYRQRFKAEFENEFIRISVQKEKHAASAVIGTSIHRMAEAILKEDEFKTDEDKLILSHLERVANKVNAERDVYQGSNFYNQLKDTLTQKSEEIKKKIEALKQANREMLYKVDFARIKTTKGFEGKTYGEALKMVDTFIPELKAEIEKLEANKNLTQDEQNTLKELKGKLRWYSHLQIQLLQHLKPFGRNKRVKGSTLTEKDGLQYINNEKEIEEYEQELEIVETDRHILITHQHRDFYNEKLYGMRGNERYDSYVKAEIQKVKKLSNQLVQYADFYNNFKKFREDVKKKGGIFRVEYKLLMNNIMAEPGSKTMAGGQIDILVIYPDEENVPVNLRNKVQIYDIKTLNKSDTDSAINNLLSSRVYPGSKQKKHTAQLQIYANAIQNELGMEVESIHVIPIVVPYHAKTKKRMALEDEYNNAMKKKGLSNDEKANLRKKLLEGIKKLSDGPIDGSYTSGNMIFYKAPAANDSNAPSFSVDIRRFGINYQAGVDIAKQFFDSRDALTPQQKEFEDTQRTEQTKKYVDELNQLTDSLKIHISKKIEGLRQALSKNPHDDKKTKKELIQLQQDLATVDQVKALAYFIEASNKELNGDPSMKRPGYLDRLNALLYKYKYENEINSHELMKELDSIRTIAESYDILDTIKRLIDNNSDKKELETIVKSELYQELEQAIKAKNKIQDLYHTNISELLAEKLSTYASKNADRMLAEIEKTSRKQIEDDIKFFTDKIAKKEDVEYYTSKLKAAEKALLRLTEMVKGMDFSKEALLAEFKQASKDISYIDMMFFSGLNTNDKVLALFAKMVKFQIYDSEQKLKTVAVKMQKALDKLENVTSLNHSNSNKTYEPILETVELTQWNPIKNEYETGKVTKIISKVGVREHTLLDGRKGTFTHTEIMNDFKKHMGIAYDNGNREEYQRVKKLYDKWKDDNLEREYVDEYYEWKDSLPEYIREKLDAISEKIKEIKDEALKDVSSDFPTGRNTFFLTPEERYEVKRLENERKQLANKSYPDGTEKTGDDLKIAEELIKYNKQFAKFYNFDQNNELFERNRLKAERMYGLDSAKYREWVKLNTIVTLTDQFWNDYRIVRAKQKVFKVASAYGSMYHNNRFYIESFFSDIIFNKIPAYRGDKLEDYVLELLVKGLEDKVINDAVSIYVTESYNQKLNKENEIQDLLDNILKAHRVKGIVDPSLMSKEVLAQIKEYEEELNYQRQLEFEDSKQSYIEERRAINSDIIQKNNYYQIKTTISKENENLVAYEPTEAYYETIDTFERAIANAPTEELKAQLREDYEEWKENNHVYDSVFDVTRPTRAWTQIVPANTVNKLQPTSKYHNDRTSQLQQLKKKYVRFTDQELEIELKKTKWYKDNHDEASGAITNRAYQERMPDSYYSTREPNASYSSTSIKEEFKRKHEDVYDHNGNIKPLLYQRGHDGKKGKELWLNKNYTKLSTNKPWFEFRNAIQEIYDEVQALLPAAYRKGGIIPQIPKERLVEIFSSTEGSIVDKSKAVIKKIKESSVISSEQEDITDKKTGNTNLKTRFIPVHYISQLEDSEVTKDIVNSILVFAGMATRHNALSETLAETRALLSVLERREGESGLGTMMQDALGKPVKDSDASKAGIDKAGRQRGETNTMRKTREFIEMQIFEEMNKPNEMSLFNKNLRVDKLLDGVMGITSFLQIGGATAILWGSTGAWVKGLTNALNANTQVFIEAAANEFFTTAAWRKGLFKYVLAVKTDFAKDLSKVTNMSLAGQIFDLFDPMVGEFKDKTGRAVPRSHFQKLFTTDLWFMNQYAGEHQTATTMMFAYLDSLKVIDGKVVTLEEYIQSKKEKKGKDLTRAEKTRYEIEYHQIKENLLDSLELDKKTGMITVKKGVNYDFNSDQHKHLKMRLQAIGKKLQGAYSQFDRNLLQRSSTGRALMMYKKYLAPAISRRFEKLNRDEELGAMNEGYYRTFLWRVSEDLINLYAMATGKQRHADNRDRFVIPKMILRSLPFVGKRIELNETEADTTGLTDLQYNNLKKAFREIGTILLLTIAVSLLAPGDDEDKKKVGAMRWLMLYELERLRKELNALTFVHPKAWEDNWKLIKNPVAGTGFVDKLVKLLMQFSDPFAEYKTTSGPHERGDSKLLSKFIGLFQSVTKNNVFLNNGKMDRVLRQDYDNLNAMF